MIFSRKAIFPGGAHQISGEPDLKLICPVSRHGSISGCRHSVALVQRLSLLLIYYISFSASSASGEEPEILNPILLRGF